MRIRGFILDKPEPESSARHHVTPPERVNEWYALLSTYKQLLTQTLQTNYISGNRTPVTHTLCAIVPARRLCGN
jgi:hypothetical protein